MKKIKKTMVVALILLVYLFSSYMMLPKYKLYNSISISNAYSGTRDTRLMVIVYHFWDYNSDNLMEKIRQEHMMVNDNVDTSLEINLYYSKWSDEPFRTERYFRE